MISKKPDWLRVKSTCSKEFFETLNIIKPHKIHTVCEEASCPNIGECWRHKTATFLIMGDICTRNCGFCDIKSGCPQGLDPNEPKKVAQSVSELNLEYAVITSVTRDDLEDGGAEHFSKVIFAIKEQNPKTKVEILTPDFRGNKNSVKTVLGATPDVFGHNIEVVKRLHAEVKKKPSSYETSLNFLKTIKEFSPNTITKTGMMVGVGERKEDVFETIDDIKSAGVDIMTIGQYLAPSSNHFGMVRYITPEEFDEFRKYGERLGLIMISGPLVRSSYKAYESYKTLCQKSS